MFRVQSHARCIPELLSPAGSAEALRAAVCEGANAVYLGYQRFGARAEAVNFDDEALERAVAYTHLHHVRVHVTVNTLLKPAEVEQVYEALRVIALCKTDAIIVQDLAVARLARECFPTLTLHASTQMALHTPDGADFARRHGFSRVVLARECDLATVRAVAATGMETEVFVHGALCSGVSGQCLMSSMAGGRSGNRGRCAQPCRQSVTLQGETAAFLSMRDLCLRDRLPELASAGVASLKIEGRLKRPEYVAVVTRAYRKALDALASGSFEPAAEAERNELLQIFQRGGFTQGHLFGAEDAALVCPERINHGGVALGAVRAVRGPLAEVALTADLHNDDSVQIRGRSDVELRYAGPDRPSGETALLRLREPGIVRAGDAAYKLADALQLADAARLTEPPIPVRMRAELLVGQPALLTATDGETRITVSGEVAQAPRTRACTEDELRRQLSKLGDTPFALQSLDVNADDVFLPVSALNALRRDALAALSEARADAFFGKPVPIETRPAPLIEMDTRTISSDLPETFGLLATSPDAALAADLLAAGATAFAFAPEDMRADALAPLLDQLPDGCWLQLPAFLPQADLDALLPLLEARKASLAGVILGSVGQLGTRFPIPAALGAGVPVCNPTALRELQTESFVFWTLWPEWSADELLPLRDVSKPKLICAYGRETLMLLCHCPARVRLGLRSGHADCRLCDDGAPGALRGCELTDRRGYRFPLTRTRTSRGCVVNVLGALPLDLSAYKGKLDALNAGLCLRFTVESAEEQLAVTRRFAALRAGENPPPSDAPTTKGLFLRGAQ